MTKESLSYYLDTEFYEYSKKVPECKAVPTIDLISIAMVATDGRVYYALNRDHDIRNSWQDKWIRENVFKPIYDEYHTEGQKFDYVTMVRIFIKHAKHEKRIAEELSAFITPEEGKEKASIYGWYSAYDWVVFCKLFNKMINLPEHLPYYMTDLKAILKYIEETRGIKISEMKGYPVNKNKHHPVSDADWNMSLHRFLQTF